MWLFKLVKIKKGYIQTLVCPLFVTEETNWSVDGWFYHCLFMVVKLSNLQKMRIFTSNICDISV